MKVLFSGFAAATATAAAAAVAEASTLSGPLISAVC